MANEPEYTKDLTILGQKTRNPLDKLETFPAPVNTQTV